MVDADKNKLGLLAATSYIVGTIIGSGIFVSPTAILTYAGSIGLSLIIWVVGGLIATMSSLFQCWFYVYIELGTSIRESGGEFAYLNYVRWYPFAFAFLWSSTIITSSCSCAILTITFGQYITEAVQPIACLSSSHRAIATKLFGFSLLLLIMFVNMYSLKKYAGRIQIVIAIAKLLSVAIIIVTGFYFITFKGSTQNFTNGNFFKGTMLTPANFVLSVYGGVWAYSGYDVLNYGAEDIKNYKRTLPIAVVGGLFLCIIIYLLTNIAYFAILTPSEMLASEAVATTFCQKTLGDFSYAMPAIVGVLMTGTINSDVFMFSRFMFAGARRGNMPTCWALINEETESPRVTVLFHSVFAICFSFVGAVNQLIQYMIVCGMLQQCFVVSALLYIRLNRMPVHNDAITFPLIVPVVLLVISAALVVIPCWNDWMSAVVGFGVALCWLVVYFIRKWTWPIKPLVYINDVTTKFCQRVFWCVVVTLDNDALKEHAQSERKTKTRSDS
ncbi:Y+L amino acid transporter 2 [Toxocara canis]|uniref:Y+L amino acid transporter 2 n=1 Tax=Toxocara canis TaxID=6265 RepID=A0A0B2VT27_TOXCA|nr:Y+L amino acid transporter 2 [Toxocara canis]